MSETNGVGVALLNGTGPAMAVILVAGETSAAACQSQQKFMVGLLNAAGERARDRITYHHDHEHHIRHEGCCGEPRPWAYHGCGRCRPGGRGMLEQSQQNTLKPETAG